MSTIVVYADEGVSGTSLKQTVRSLQLEVDLAYYTIKRMDARALTTQDWEKETVLLVVPGGRDIYYQKALSYGGTEKIKAFVRQGGSYLGICAGAYFGSDSIEFAKGKPLEVCAKRSLEFYPGLAKGPAYKSIDFFYEDERGAEAALISWNTQNSTQNLQTGNPGILDLGQETLITKQPICKQHDDGEASKKILSHLRCKSKYFVYFNGGCFFVSPEKYPNVEVLATYVDIEGTPPAIVLCSFGKGRALLSGVHMEYGSFFLARDNPHLEHIKSKLEEDEIQRRHYFREMLKLLSINIFS